MGVRGRPSLFERYVISTWGSYFLVLRWVSRGPERGVFGPDWKWHPIAEFFLPSQFVLFRGTGSRSAPAALHRQTGIPAKPRPGTGGGRQREARVWARGECGPSFREGVPLGTGAVDALRWTPTVASIPLARKGVCPHSTRTHPQRAHSAHTHDRARCATRHVHCHMHVL